MLEDAPRPILGSPGSRIRLIFGEHVSTYLLTLDEDDGDSKWQTSSSASISSELRQRLQKCIESGRRVKEFALGPTGAWYFQDTQRIGSSSTFWLGATENAEAIKVAVLDSSGEGYVSFGSCSYSSKEAWVVFSGRLGYFEWSGNVHDGLISRVQRTRRLGKVINFIRLFAGGAYFVSDDDGYEWAGLSSECSEELKCDDNMIEDIAVSADRNWVVLRSNSFAASAGVSFTVTCELMRFYREQKARIRGRKREELDHNNRLSQQNSMRSAEETAEENEEGYQERLETARLQSIHRENCTRADSSSTRNSNSGATIALRRPMEAGRKSEKIRLAAIAENKLIANLTEEKRIIEESQLLVSFRKAAFLASYQMLSCELRIGLELSKESMIATQAKMSEVECVICQDKPAVRAVVPCGHQCLCDDCAGVMAAKEIMKCPMCRCQIRETLKNFGKR